MYKNKIMNKVAWTKSFTWLIMFAALAFSGCFSPWKGDKTTIVLSLNGGSPGRAAVFPPDDEAVFSRFEHTVELSNPSENITFQAKGGSTIKAVVAPGIWDISVQTFLDGELYATGSAIADLQFGQDNIVPLTMYRAFTTVTIAEGIQHGSITASPDSGVAGTRITVTIQADPGYRLKTDSLTITPAATLSGTGNTRTFILPDADVTVSGEFEEMPIYAVTVADGIQHGSITTSPDSSYEGATITVTIQANDGYRLKAGSLHTTPAVELNGSGNSRTFFMPDADVTVSGEFEEISSASIQIRFDGIADETIDLTVNIENDIYWHDTLEVTVNGDYDSYQWYMDGNSWYSWDTPTIELYIYGEVNSYFIGIHNLMAVVIKDGVPYSKELIFRVKYREGP